MTVYAVSPLAQKTEVDKHCFGDCMKILVGGIEICGGRLSSVLVPGGKYEENRPRNLCHPSGRD
jgi:hypothetical protein